MSAWGSNNKSCKSLLDRVEQNDPILTELVILPTKMFGAEEVDRLVELIEMGNNTHLRRLSASGHKIPDESLYKLGRALAVAAGKQKAAPVSLAIGDSTMGHTGIQALTKGIKEGGGCTDLEDIDLSWKGMGSSAFEILMDSCNAKSIPKLRALNLSRNGNLGDKPSENLSLTSFAHLEELNLSHCGLSGEFVAQFLACLQSQSPGIKPSLKKLYLQENPLGTKGVVALLPLFADSCLQVLNLSRCQVCDDALSKIHTTASLTNKNNLLTLDLSYNDISATGAGSLSEAMSSDASVLSSLVELNLAGNPLGDTGVLGLARALQCRHLKGESATTSLKKLDLSDTQCGIQGATNMMSLGQLESLHLFNNSLGSEGLRALAPAIQEQNSLLELDLGGNGADEASVVALLNALTAESVQGGSAVSKNLKVLVVGGNEGGDAVERMVAKVQQAHPHLDIARDKTAQRRST